jgi:predicted phosphatase
MLSLVDAYQNPLSSIDIHELNHYMKCSPTPECGNILEQVRTQTQGKPTDYIRPAQHLLADGK